MLHSWTARLAASVALLGVAVAVPFPARAADDLSFWSAYQNVLRPAKHVDLTHTITPHIPVWAGFAESTFAPA